MINQIFIMGQCTMHWGRMEFGNVGNYYIVEPMFKEIRKNFPSAKIVTTMQFSNGFCQRFRIDTVPMELYYDFDSDCNLSNALREFESVKNGNNFSSPYIEQIKKSDFVIDFSGDIWGDNADFLGKDRFVTGCYKDLTAQLLKPTVMIAGSPGPFDSYKNITLAKQAYSGFAFVTNREPISTQLLDKQGFDISKTYNFPCPSFLFEKSESEDVNAFFTEMRKNNNNQLIIGFILCGWNFSRGPFNAWPRDDEEYSVFKELITHIIEKYKSRIILLSHSNGFDTPPAPFCLKHGRDYPIMQQFRKMFDGTKYDSYITLLDDIYLPCKTKEIISHFDILISGRMHGAVAGLSQSVPTVIIDYGHEPKAHKLIGFAEVVCDNKSQEIITSPNDIDEIINKVDSIIDNRKTWQSFLIERNKVISKKSREQFSQLTTL